MKLLKLTITILLSTSLSAYAQVWGINGSRTDYRNNAGEKGQAGAVSGFFQAYYPGNYPSTANYPVGASEWWHFLDVRHDNPTNNFAMQFAGSFGDQQLYFRKTNNHDDQAWSKILIQDPNGYLSEGKLNLRTSAGQSFFTGQQFGSTYSFPNGIFRAITDNPNGQQNFYFDGVTAGETKFSIRADGQGYFNGNLGIGTSSPESKLHIKKKDAYADASSTATTVDNLLVMQVPYAGANPQNYNGSGYKWGIKFYGATDGSQSPDVKSSGIYAVSEDGSMGYNRAVGLAFHTSSFDNITSERLRIDATGNVGIGTSDTKGYKLAVAGKMVVEEVKVKLQSAWPDYVFDKEHKLLPLSEVEKFISENKHLPEVPSAKETENQGINLGEMNKILLQKIEELTLYSIEQNKKISDLIIKNEGIQKRLESLEKTAKK